MMFVAAVTQNGWQFGLHDRTFVGWFAVFSYCVATVLCVVVALNTERIGPDTQRRKFAIYWWVLAIITLLLGINKQLDLHSWMTQTLRQMAREDGWYQHRKIFQFWFIVGLAAGLIVLVGVIAQLMRGMVKRSLVAMVGLCLVVFWVLTRAASFHHVDDPTEGLISFSIGPVKMRWIIELTGIYLIVAGAASNLIWGRERRERRVETRIIQEQRIDKGKPTHAASAMLGQFPHPQEQES